MEIAITEIEACKLLVHYEANALEIMDKRAEVWNAFKKAPVKGFREGKASMDAIKIHYRQQIDDALKRALAEEAFHNTVFDKQLRPHGAPKFNALMLDGGKFSCDFEMYTKPDFELTPFLEMEVPQPHNIQSVEEVTEKMLQELRVRLGDVAPYEDDDFIQDGDNVIIDYEGSIDGAKLDNLCAIGEMISVGSTQIPDFDNNILGMKPGEIREFDIHAPQGGLPSISGKTIHFKVSFTTGTKNMPCPLNDELAIKLGKKDFTELREFVSGAAQGQTQTARKQKVHEAIAKRLVADNVINVPNWMSLSEAQYVAHQSKLDWNIISDQDKEALLQMAEQNVKLALVLDKVREASPEAQLTDQEVFEIIKQNLAQTKVQKPINEVIEEMNRTGYLQILFSRIRDEATMDFISKSAKIIE